MKIDILTPIRFGGPQKWGDELVTALRKKGIDAVNIHNFFGIIKRFFFSDADIIHTTLPLFFKFHKKPVILTIHGDYRKENFSKYFYPIAIKKANFVTVPTKFLMEELNLKNCKVIPNFIFLDNYKKVKHKKKESLRIVTVTSFKFLDKAKGVLELFKILEEVKKEIKKEFDFVVVGGGPYLKKIIEESKNYSFRIKFTGFHKNPKEILEKSDLFLYYSYLDNFPIVILEAMACNLPIVSNDVGGIKEIIKISKNKEEFKKNLLKLLNCKNIKNVRNNKKIKNYSWEKGIDRFINLYKNCYR